MGGTVCSEKKWRYYLLQVYFAGKRDKRLGKHRGIAITNRYIPENIIASALDSLSQTPYLLARTLNIL